MSDFETNPIGTMERLRRCEEALKPFARIADMEEKAKAGASVIVNISRCREARAALTPMTKPEQEGV